MTHAQLTEKIASLGYQGCKEAYQRQSEEVSYSTMSFEERLYQLLDAQEIFLKNKRITMNHRLSKIKDKQASLEGLFNNLCQSGKITHTQGETDEYRNRCGAVCS